MRGNGVPTICHGFKPFAPCKRTKGVNSPSGTFAGYLPGERSGVLDTLTERGHGLILSPCHPRPRKGARRRAGGFRSPSPRSVSVWRNPR